LKNRGEIVLVPQDSFAELINKSKKLATPLQTKF
jgi:hypothetical protein